MKNYCLIDFPIMLISFLVKLSLNFKKFNPGKIFLDKSNLFATNGAFKNIRLQTFMEKSSRDIQFFSF